jgi:Flp pilus assembly secretin CpaC
VFTTYGLDEKEPYFEDGVKIKVTPTINTASNITVNIQPTLDQLESEADAFVAPDGTRFFGKTTKTINTVFSLASGQTAAIGGLTRTSSNELERKVPVLGSIPLIGRLFSYRATQKGQVETIIFVTVGLANPEHINMETGLPQESSLAMRHDATSRTERQINAEELKILQQSEAERSQAAVQKLQAAAQKKADKANK